MAYSLDFLEDIRKSLIETIQMVERENTVLSAKIDSLKEPRKSHLDVEEDQKFLQELRLNETINGLSFRNVRKEVLDDNTHVKIKSDVISGREECSLVIITKASNGKVKEFTLTIEDSSSLMEIKSDLCSLVEDLNLTYALKAIASFSRMNELRSQTLDDILEAYGDFFKVEIKMREESGESIPDSVVVSAANKNRHRKYFEVIWNLKWNHGKLSIEHMFFVTRLQGLSKLQALEPKLKQLESGGFLESMCSDLVDLWRDIGKLVADQ